MALIMWIIYAVLSIVASLVTMLFSPIIVLFAKDDGYLPYLLAWCGQEDNSLDGDTYFNDPLSHPVINRLPRYIRRVIWLCRNPAQVYDAQVAADLSANESISVYGNDKVSDQPHFVPGYCFARVGKYWMLYVTFPTFKNMCCRIYFGWKLMDYLHGTRPDKARLTVSANPFMTRGKF